MCIRDQFSEEYLLVTVETIDDNIHESMHLGLELMFLNAGLLLPVCETGT